MVDLDADAAAWLDNVYSGAVRADWPELVYAEVANTLLKLHRAGDIAFDRCRLVMDAVVLAPVSATRLSTLAPLALGRAHRAQLSVYDACYLVLAETLDAPLVTADRRLAAATPNAVLLAT